MTANILRALATAVLAATATIAFTGDNYGVAIPLFIATALMAAALYIGIVQTPSRTDD